MIVVAQRVSRASVTVDGERVGAIEHGLCLLVCALDDDLEPDVEWLADKLVDLRLFADEEGLSNRSLLDVGGSALVVPQFTLAADWRKGRRPSFTRSAEPARARQLVDCLSARLGQRGVSVAAGRFGAMMALELLNDGPFTLVLDSRQSPTRRAATGGPAEPELSP
ncbi:MAG: D-tyrosyl-tRNA(Tyr) deacylase [Planctomycetota bacterium]|nr:MAG: D-tyrosyl-tRNA(Tyr) deacylase [Planctomycetota bacterium]